VKRVAFAIFIVIEGRSVTVQRGTVQEDDARDLDHEMNKTLAHALCEFAQDCAIRDEMEGT
jgi:hypothetical protein